MSSDGFIDPADELADTCIRNHTDRPDDGCENCSIRGEIQHCAQCGADYVDGRWYTAPGSTTPNGCDHESLVDDWGNEVTCTVITGVEDFWASKARRCGSPVTTPGKSACDHHQRILDQEECGRIYQRMVARAS